MLVVTAKFVVAEGSEEGFLPLILENAARSLADEPGCHQFDVCQGTEKLNEIFLYELYDDAAAFDHHKTTPHFARFASASEPMIVSKSVQTYSLVSD